MEEPMEEQSVEETSVKQPQTSEGDQKPAERKKLPSLLRPVVIVPSAVMGAISMEEYEMQYWPKLENAIVQLLTQTPGDYIPISYEQMYSCVYKCVCQQHSERMYNDLMSLVIGHLQRVSQELKSSPPDAYVERFNFAMTQYMQALGGIAPIFNYMNRFYVSSKLNTDLKEELQKLFTLHVAEQHISTLFPMLQEAQNRPFAVSPPTMANIIKTLHSLRPDLAPQYPDLFARFIPNVLPQASADDLPRIVEETRRWQQELLEREGFARGETSRKRSGDELQTKPTPLSFMPKNSC
ncbi:CDK2-associated and cullin domain-containing protein 1-like isoform X1 [Branchiostoma floridae]|uniref:CDK2-associated and cullin domain-containing protein 1-like isoform X1 n=1 Tax=Branchiostoma floridae TaxID=7739 RepID=A0A9J7MLK9_BRAFL|nr:CDK2-associated and cullin domain-containing protein 1-like isoform X1 [Branchiostoma floridae]